MFDRNTLIAFGLMFLLIVGFYFYNKPSAAQEAQMAKTQDSLALVAKKLEQEKKPIVSADSIKKIGKLDSIERKKQLGSFDVAASGKEEMHFLQNKFVKVGFSSKGGRIASVALPEYKTWDKKSIVQLLANGKNDMYFQLNTANSNVKSKDLIWKKTTSNDSTIVFEIATSNGGIITQQYTLNKNQYLVDYKIKVKNIQNDILKASSDIKLVWNATLTKQEKDTTWEEQRSTIYFKANNDNVNSLSLTNGHDNSDVKAKLEWVCFKQQYFNATLASADAFETDSKLSWDYANGDSNIRTMHSEMFLSYKPEDTEKSYNMQFYFGPNSYKILKNTPLIVKNHDLHRTMDVGWGIFGWINRGAVIPIFNFLNSFMGKMGWLILCLTIIIKMILLPLVYRSYLSTAKMRILKPEIDQIKDKYNGDMQKSQVETMALYKKAGVSPMSGCIPMVLQMPVLFAMFQLFPNMFELRQQAFLWSDDLSRYDSILNFGFNIPFYGDHVSLFTLLMTVSTLVYTYFNNQISGVTGQMKYIGYIMPVIFLGVLNSYASGLTWYYFVSNIITFTQQYLIKRFTNEDKLHAQIAENRKKPVKKSAFAARLEQAMKQQQAQKKRK